MNMIGGGGSNRIHTCVVFGGYAGPLEAGAENIRQTSGAAIFAEKVRALGLTVRDWEGSLDDADVIGPAADFVRETFNPVGKLIVYGYSAGGMNALRFSRELNRRLHSFTARGFLDKGANEDSSNDVILDLLITIDAYNPDARPTDYRVEGNVRQFINIYQRHAQHVTGSMGARVSRDGEGGDRDCNQDRTEWDRYKKAGRGTARSGAHAIIDDYTHQTVFEKVEALLSGGTAAVSCRLRDE
jgi:hypothetical protein